MLLNLARGKLPTRVILHLRAMLELSPRIVTLRNTVRISYAHLSMATAAHDRIRFAGRETSEVPWGFFMPLSRLPTSDSNDSQAIYSKQE